MQLEIKIVIDFGEAGPAPGDTDAAFRFVDGQLQAHVLQPTCTIYGARATTNTGWTSSGDDEE